MWSLAYSIAIPRAARKSLVRKPFAGARALEPPSAAPPETKTAPGMIPGAVQYGWTVASRAYTLSFDGSSRPYPWRLSAFSSWKARKIEMIPSATSIRIGIV